MEPDYPPPESKPPDDEEPKRSGRARERQRRRRQRLQKTEQSQPRPSRQVLPSSRVRITLPTIRIPRLGLMIGAIIGVILVIGVILFLRRLKPATPEALPNALWIGTEWTYEDHTPEDVAALAQKLQASDIGTVYAWVSWLQDDGTWRSAENFTHVRAFAEQLKAAYPTLNVYGWISFPVNSSGDTDLLANEELQQNIADFSASIVSELGFGGVFLNVEPVWDGDENFLALLRKVRASVGESVPIAAAIPPDWSPKDAGIPVPPLIVPGTVWSQEYKQSVALLTDEMVVMAYNSGLSTADDYAQWMAYQVETYARAVSQLGEGTVLLIGIPTYEAEPPGHDPAVENVDSALQGYDAGLQQAGSAASFVRGVAIFADWTTDDLEWAQFGQWLKRP